MFNGLDMLGLLFCKKNPEITLRRAEACRRRKVEHLDTGCRKPKAASNINAHRKSNIVNQILQSIYSDPRK